MDTSNKQQFTPHLSKLAEIIQSPKPYNTTIDLNWPNINIPLLILAANKTVDNGNPSNIYYIQCLKYQ